MTAQGIPGYQPAGMGTKHMVATNSYLMAQVAAGSDQRAAA